MRAPGNHEVPNPMRYYVARKAEYALLCMAMCDADRRFTVYRAPSVATRSESLTLAARQELTAYARPCPPRPSVL